MPFDSVMTGQKVRVDLETMVRGEIRAIQLSEDLIEEGDSCEHTLDCELD